MVREMAAETLGLNANGSVAADPLIAALTDEFWQVRLKAIRSLGKMKIDRAVRPIGGCITHEQANLRKEAAAALGEIADPDGEPYLATGGQRCRSGGAKERPLGAAANRGEESEGGRLEREMTLTSNRRTAPLHLSPSSGIRMRGALRTLVSFEFAEAAPHHSRCFASAFFG